MACTMMLWIMATTTPVAFDPERWLHSLDKMISLAPWRAYLTHFGPLEDPALAKRLLTDDIKINSQELEIWLSRREKQRGTLNRQDGGGPRLS